jgi:AcrR family transcriptional regulator
MKVSAAPKRRYRMGARAEKANATRRRIIDAVTTLFAERWIEEISLDEVASRAGVTVQTVIRRFGGKAELIAAAADEAERDIVQQRFAAPVGDIAGAVRNLFDHYEAVGDLALRILTQVDHYPSTPAFADRGRQLHYQWVERTFAPQIALAAPPDRERLRASLITLADVYVWKLLRRDLLLDRDQAELALREMLAGVLHPFRRDHTHEGDE